MIPVPCAGPEKQVELPRLNVPKRKWYREKEFRSIKKEEPFGKEESAQKGWAPTEPE